MSDRPNQYDTRESWLRAAANEIRPYFASLEHKLPDGALFAVPENIRFAIAFPSTGRNGKRLGETWHSQSSDDGHYEIFIRADVSEPFAVIVVLLKQLIHAALPDEAGHGKLFRDAAIKIGLEPPMRKATLTAKLQKRLEDIAAKLGPLPHAALHIDQAPLTAVNPPPVALAGPKKQKSRTLLAECLSGCASYKVRIAATPAREIGAPHCPKHGPMHVHFQKGGPGDAEDAQDAEDAFERTQATDVDEAAE